MVVPVDVTVPSTQSPVVDESNRVTIAWNRFFQSLWERTGGSSDIVAQSSPTGAMIGFGADSAPVGWLLCDGSAVSRGTYDILFSVIGTTYGAGDGSTTFNVPDSRGRALVGAGAGAGLTNRTVGDTGGLEEVALTDAQNGAHSHGVTDAGHTHGVTDSGHDHAVTDPGHDHAPNSGNFVLDNAGTEYDNTNGDKGTTDGLTASSTTGLTVDSDTTGLTVNSGTTGVTVNSDGSGDAHENMMPFLVPSFIIKT